MRGYRAAESEAFIESWRTVSSALDELDGFASLAGLGAGRSIAVWTKEGSRAGDVATNYGTAGIDREGDGQRAAVTVHTLRHTHASLAIKGDPDRGIPPVGPKELSRRLGHSSVAFTMDTYVWLFEDPDAPPVDVLGP